MRYRTVVPALLLAICTPALAQQLAIRGKTVHTMGPAGSITDGVVLIDGARIKAVGPAKDVEIPAGCRVLEAVVVTPGLIDAHATAGLTGIQNQRHDSDQLETSAAIQPELRAIDAYNPQEPLIQWLRSFGITTLHTGHAPGELISGQTLIVKTTGLTVEAALLRAPAAIAATLGPDAQKGDGKSPGTRGKMVAMLRADLLKAQAHARKRAGDADKQPEPDLRLDALGDVLAGKLPLMITAHRAQDIRSALRLAEEFNIRFWLDGAAEAYLLIDEIKAAGVPVLVHPTMRRAYGETENLSFETAARLRAAGVPIALQSGYEDYVPKVRVVLFEAGVAAAHGLGSDAALASITIDAARLLGIEARVGSLEPGKDADVALYDGDPFEYVTHCVGVVIDGKVVSEVRR